MEELKDKDIQEAQDQYVEDAMKKGYIKYDGPIPGIPKAQKTIDELISECFEIVSGLHMVNAELMNLEGKIAGTWNKKEIGCYSKPMSPDTVISQVSLLKDTLSSVLEEANTHIKNIKNTI